MGTAYLTRTFCGISICDFSMNSLLHVLCIIINVTHLIHSYVLSMTIPYYIMDGISYLQPLKCYKLLAFFFF